MTPKGSRSSRADARLLGVLLRKLANVVEALSPDEIDNLLRGDSKLRVEEASPVPRERGLSPTPSLFKANLFHELTDKLRSAMTREAGYDLLNKARLTRIETEKYARFLDLPVYRTDTISLLRERIVESLIGARLRTEAIQGRKPFSRN